MSAKSLIFRALLPGPVPNPRGYAKMSSLNHLNNAGRRYQDAAEYEQANHLAHRQGGSLGNMRNLYSDHKERLANGDRTRRTQRLENSLNESRQRIAPERNDLQRRKDVETSLMSWKTTRSGERLPKEIAERIASYNGQTAVGDTKLKAGKQYAGRDEKR
ncbi:hypothetical protein GJ744_010873 [Endocarpon pusillum]|uniref:Uncharacterized protein n=1 Tax=Endocarpon pusillum TaxID=364733 RepID=A0A8H7E581_9EURO|nr:hypothetical protein GJ744_010873 [Endocarpon pusillum]